MKGYHEYLAAIDMLQGGDLRHIEFPKPEERPLPEPDLMKMLVGTSMRAALNATAALDGRRGRIVRKVTERCAWIDRGSPYGPCLEWNGPDSGKPGRGREKGRGHSYARMCLEGVTVAVHRVVWVTLNGYLPPKKQLDHLCCNRKCVLHCEPVTHKENQRRRDAKRRG